MFAMISPQLYMSYRVLICTHIAWTNGKICLAMVHNNMSQISTLGDIEIWWGFSLKGHDSEGINRLLR